MQTVNIQVIGMEQLNDVEVIGDLFITVTKVYPQDRSVYFHVVSFIRTANDKITSMDEYWADDGNPPQWRIDKQIGTPII